MVNFQQHMFGFCGKRTRKATPVSTHASRSAGHVRHFFFPDPSVQEVLRVSSNFPTSSFDSYFEYIYCLTHFEYILCFSELEYRNTSIILFTLYSGFLPSKCVMYPKKWNVSSTFYIMYMMQCTGGTKVRKKRKFAHIVFQTGFKKQWKPWYFLGQPSKTSDWTFAKSADSDHPVHVQSIRKGSCQFLKGLVLPSKSVD